MVTTANPNIAISLQADDVVVAFDCILFYRPQGDMQKLIKTARKLIKSLTIRECSSPFLNTVRKSNEYTTLQVRATAL